MTEMGLDVGQDVLVFRLEKNLVRQREGNKKGSAENPRNLFQY